MFGKAAWTLERISKGVEKEAQEVFDRLFTWAKFHTYTAVCPAPPWQLETVFFFIRPEHEKMLTDIR
jgi:hypothetical protein